LNEQHVKDQTPRAKACLTDLKSLNPFCKVDVWSHELTGAAIDAHGTNVQGTGKPFTAIIVTEFLPKAQLFALDEYARSNKIVFVIAINNGVTASIFSDFGPEHIITDRDGEPTQPLALVRASLLPCPAVPWLLPEDSVMGLFRLTLCAGTHQPADVKSDTMPFTHLPGLSLIPFTDSTHAHTLTLSPIYANVLGQLRSPDQDPDLED
jgi:hypothetical protein